jgi:putative mRNA 3-end processing factor
MEDVHAQVEYFDFSAHAGRSELLKFIKHVNPQRVVCIHGDATQLFAQDLEEQGFKAFAPKIGEILRF